MADEYLRLAYHGLRAKDKSFNATMKTDFDESIGKHQYHSAGYWKSYSEFDQQCILCSNEKKKQCHQGRKTDIRTNCFSKLTKRIKDKVEITVKDNGNGIPQKVLDKIFQPFFTTKPTGQGTGLGLSLSYDIIKAHGGEIKVETKESEGVEFTIILPA